MVFDLSTLTFIHTAISFIALGTGVVAVLALFEPKISGIWTVAFLVSAVATSVTGFLFPFTQVLPSHIVGGVALVVLAVLLLARFGYGRAGAWRSIDAIGLVASLYLLVLVTIVQAFLKIGALNAFAPSGTEWPFLVAQLVALAACVWIGYRAVAGARRAPDLRIAK